MSTGYVIDKDMRIVLFGSYERHRQPRMAVFREGFAALGDETQEVNAPLDLETAARLRMLRRPWMLGRGAMKVVSSWRALIRTARQIERPNAIVVGYLAQFDVHLARRLWPDVPIVLDHMAPAEGMAIDRRTPRLTVPIMRQLDRWAVGVSDVICMDTYEHLMTLPERVRLRSLAVPIGAEERWFSPPKFGDGRLKVIFYGSFTPLQGAAVIGEAVKRLSSRDEIEFTIIGKGQDFEATKANASENPRVSWKDWVDAERLPSVVAEHDVCLGIFGETPKAGIVVPHKVYEGAAAGCAVVTSDTGPQRRAFQDDAVFVPAGDSRSLANALIDLASDRDRLANRRKAAYWRAEKDFRPKSVVAPLREFLIAVSSQ